MTLDFGTNENWLWDSGRLVVQFEVKDDGGKSYLCRVSREYIADNFGNPGTDTECFQAAKEHFDQITDLAGFFISAGQFEEDGSVLIR